MWVVPLGATILVVGLLTFYGLYLRDQERAAYSLPVDRSPQSLLEFMRTMDGSVEQPSEILGVTIKNSNLMSVCQAVVSASDCLHAEYTSLAKEQQREANFYRLKYSGWLCFLDSRHKVSTDLDIWVQESRQFLSTAEVMGFQERVVAENVIRLMRHSERNSEALEFIRWLQPYLESQSAIVDSRSREFADKTKRIAAVIELLSTELELTSQTLQGEAFDLKSLRGKVVLIEFWGTRCQPCIEDFPALRRMYQLYRERGFEIVGICLGSEPERIRRLTVEQKLPWVQLCHDRAASDACNQGLQEMFLVDSVPTTYLLDKSGKVVAQSVRPAQSQTERSLEHALKKLLPL
jgi:peroxiredoxin